MWLLIFHSNCYSGQGIESCRGQSESCRGNPCPLPITLNCQPWILPTTYRNTVIHRAVNSSHLQILRIDGMMVDDIIVHGTWHHLWKKVHKKDVVGIVTFDLISLLPINHIIAYTTIGLDKFCQQNFEQIKRFFRQAFCWQNKSFSSRIWAEWGKIHGTNDMYNSCKMLIEKFTVSSYGSDLK